MDGTQVAVLQKMYNEVFCGLQDGLHITSLSLTVCFMHLSLHVCLTANTELTVLVSGSTASLALVVFKLMHSFIHSTSFEIQGHMRTRGWEAEGKKIKAPLAVLAIPLQSI